MRWGRLARILVASAALCLLDASPARACGSHGTQAGGDLVQWLEPGLNAEGLMQAFVAIEDDFIVPSGPTVCVCGIGLGTTAAPLPARVQVVGAHVSVLNVVTGERAPLTAFEFASDPETQAGLEMGDSGDPATLPIFAGATWFGFSASVDSFRLPVLGADEVFVLGFDLTLPLEELPLMSTAQFAAGQGDAAGAPIFSGSHRVEYFTASDPVIELPEPSQGLAGAFGVLAIALLWHRRAGAGRTAD